VCAKLYLGLTTLEATTLKLGEAMGSSKPFTMPSFWEYPLTPSISCPIANQTNLVKSLTSFKNWGFFHFENMLNYFILFFDFILYIKSK
jgi:hypothetical protein